MAYYVCSGAKMKCTMGSSQSSLIVLPTRTIMLHGSYMGNIMDFKPMVNITPFGMCRSLANPVVAAATAANLGRLQPMPCIPNTVSPWMNGKTDVILKGQPAMLNNCKLMCMWAGNISLCDSGQ